MCSLHLHVHVKRNQLMELERLVMPIHIIVAYILKQVVFADGTFIDGSTSELSCDGPLREPYSVFCQVSWALQIGLRRESDGVCNKKCQLCWFNIQNYPFF